jgi:hypothetical protein
MASWQKVAIGVLGALWAFFLVAITITPQDAWEHLVAWWGVILSLGGILLVWQGKIFGAASLGHAIYQWWRMRRRE